MRTTVAGAAVVVCTLVLASGAMAARPVAAPPRIRALDSCARKVLAAGLRRSATFRALVEEIERSDVIVFVYTSPQLSPKVSGGLSFVGASASWRYLKVALRRPQPISQMIWVLAHELHHATEVAHATGARSQTAFNALYTHIGTAGALRDTFETEAAFATGLKVRRELGEGGG
jgi:hypothetical protein